MTDVQIRHLDEDEWFVFSQIRLTALQTNPQVFGSNYELESRFTEVEWRNRLKNSAVFLLEREEESVGMTGVSIYRDDETGKTAILWGSWLAPEFRGGGLSHLMYQTRINWAKRQPNVERLIVSHHASNVVSKIASQKHGFVLTDTKEIVWRTEKPKI